MINTCYGGSDYERHILPIKVTNTVWSENPTGFSMTNYTIYQNNAGDFRLMVQHDGETWESVNQPGKDEKPQILVLPLSWRWPKELVRINTIYPTFGEWGDGYNQGYTNNWVNNIQNKDELTEEEFYKHVVGRQAHTPTLSN